uniref:FAD-binding PCMH-type domain-containing protein n=1 Tax=Plectus sambesii TaxID=2011161 RepID=A0A914W4Y8_9BILA
MHRSELQFFVNGTKVAIAADPEWTLAFYLREKLKLKGTKIACEEGACGACTVVVGKIDPISGKPWFVSANACVTPLYLVDDCCVLTIEGLGNVRNGVHPIQERLARGHGSQCGFCTPGFVMSIYALIRNNAEPSVDDVDAALRGNLCRCTGYRPILESFYTFTNGCGKQNCCQKNPSGQSACAAASADDKQQELLTDWSSMRPYDSTQEPIFPPELQLMARSAQQDIIELSGERIRLFAPSTVAQLIELRRMYSNSHFVATGLMTGLMHRGSVKVATDPVWLVLYRVAEFHTIDISDKRVQIGSSLSISDLHSALVKANSNKKFSSLIDLLDRYSSRQVRNIASWVGNVTSGNPTSDLAVVMLALNASISVIDLKTGEQRDVAVDEKFFSRVGGNRNCLGKDDVVASISIGILSEQEHLFAVKQGMRHGADSPIVNTAIYAKLGEDLKTIEDIRLVFGGIGSAPVVAVNTAAALKNRKLDEDTLELGIATLSKEIALSENAPGGRAQYRSSLAVSFFFKFFDELSHGSSFITSPIARATPLEPLQLYTDAQSQHGADACGRPLMCQYGERHATGEADYVADVDAANMCYMALVLSSRPHAQIVSIDASEALKVKGVVGYVDAKDIPSKGTNYPGREYNQFIPDNTPVFADGKVESVGQTIGAIVAEDLQTARKAAQMVRVEYEDLPAIVTIEEAIKAESWLYNDPMNMMKGDVEKGLSESDIVLDGEVRMGGQEHVYLETQSSLASPGEGDEWTILCSTQQPTWAQTHAGYLLGVQKHKIVVKVKRIGGAFGGKTNQCGRALFPALVAAQKFRRPVRCALSRKEDFLATGRRHPMLAKYKIGMSKEGKLLAVDCNIYLDGGYSIDNSVAVLSATVAHADTVYDVPHMRVNGRVCKTNLPSNTAFRGF